MATTTVGNVLISPSTLYPPPLLIQKHPRKATFRWRRTRKSASSQSSSVYTLGPLDDIIAEIKSDIWDSPPTCSFESAWASSFGAPSSWTVTPISSTPRDKPLTIRKNRSSRSTGSGFGSSSNNRTPATGARNDHSVLSPHGGTVGPSGLPWAVLPNPPPPNLASAYAQNLAQIGVSAIAQAGVEARSRTTQRRPTGLRRFTTNLLQRFHTEGQPVGSSASVCDHDGGIMSCPHDHNLNDKALETDMRSNAGADFISFMNRVQGRFPTPAGYEPDHSRDAVTAEWSDLPTTMRTAIRILPECKVLNRDIQEMKVAIEVEGVLHNRQKLPDPAIDVVFLVDLGYYVTNKCLSRALKAVQATVYQLCFGDRVALYTTHCVHDRITRVRPDLHCPLSPYNIESKNLIGKLTQFIGRSGTQKWEPARPNPPMSEVILYIVRSMKDQKLRIGRTHVILLSPHPHVFHNIAKEFPDLYVHQINPAPLPYYHNVDKRDVLCRNTDGCCENIVVSNMVTYQTFMDRIKQILGDARSVRPIGKLRDLSINVRSRRGSEILGIRGDCNIPHLRLGQIHTIIVRIRVQRSESEDVDLHSRDPMLASSLDVNGLRQELQNGISLGAFRIHALDVRVTHRDTLHSHNSWNQSETPVLLFRMLGHLAHPWSVMLEVYKHDVFYKLTQLSPEDAQKEAVKILASLPHDAELIPSLKDKLAELASHLRIQDYERTCHQRLPWCPGPVNMGPGCSAIQEYLLRKPVRPRAATTPSVVIDDGRDRVIADIHGMGRLA